MTKIALFVDYENIHISLSKEYHFTLDVNKLMRLIQERIHAEGSVVLQKAYADWEDYPQVQSKLDRLNIKPEYVLSKKISKRDQDGNVRVLTRKNSCDIAMALDIQQTLYERKEVDFFVLVTGDRDFIIPIRLLKESDKKMLVFGVDRTTSRDLLDSLADEANFISIESLLGIEAAPEPEVVDFSSSEFDWSPFIIRLHDLEESLPFVALNYVRNTILNRSLGCGDTPELKGKFLNEALTQKILLTGKVPNPKGANTFTTTCHLNRDHSFVKAALK